MIWLCAGLRVGRHYKKLSPMVACHQELLDEFLDEFWDYYRELLAYRDSPSAELARELKSKILETVRYKKWLRTVG